MSARDPTRVKLGSVNSSKKISEKCLDLWSSILRAEPRCELTILDVDPSSRPTLLSRLNTRGIDQSRIILRERLSVREYYEVAANLDVALDTTPYSGATTTMDVLWMGTPLVALPGDRPLSRSAFSILSSAGLHELIASDEDDYIRRNLALARSSEWRAALRQSLRTRLANSAVMSVAGFVRGLEHAYAQMWSHCRQGPADGSA
jgi:predicted O-linked N-acetylglucosamine transferase (SPINDLY family)